MEVNTYLHTPTASLLEKTPGIHKTEDSVGPCFLWRREIFLVIFRTRNMYRPPCSTVPILTTSARLLSGNRKHQNYKNTDIALLFVWRTGKHSTISKLKISRKTTRWSRRSFVRTDRLIDMRRLIVSSSNWYENAPKKNGNCVPPPNSMQNPPSGRAGT